MLKNYFKTAIKVLGRRKFFTFISLFGISLTLLVLMVGAALLDNAFFPRAPESRFDRVIGVHTVGLYGPMGSMTSPPGYGFLDKYLKGLEGAEKISIFTQASPTVMYHDGRKLETHLRRTDGPYWEILDFHFVEGGPFTEAENRDARFVAVISEAMRTRMFGDQKALGRTFEVDGQRFRVNGVVADVSQARMVGFSEIWVPMRTAKTREYERQMMGDCSGIVLARSTSDFPALRRAFANRLTQYVFEDPKMFNRVETGLDTTFETVARNMFGNKMKENRVLVLRLILIGVALLFMTLPIMNLVSINLSRILERASEIGVRKAFGASSRSLIAQFLVENTILSLIGGAIGFVLTWVVLGAIERMDLLTNASFDMNLRIFGYGLGIAMLFGVLSGVYPAWRMSRMQPVAALRGGVA